MVTVTLELFQPFEFGAGDSDAELVGAVASPASRVSWTCMPQVLALVANSPMAQMPVPSGSAAAPE